jgi:hypothetical protein
VSARPRAACSSGKEEALAPRRGSRPAPAKSTGDGPSGSSDHWAGVTYSTGGVSHEHAQLATLGKPLAELEGRGGTLTAAAAESDGGGMGPPLCLMSRRRPERVLRLPDDGDPRSERQGHAVQAAGRAWQPAWLRERTTARGALELRVGGVGPERGLATSLGKIDSGRHERELRPAGNHHARCARQEKQARAACHPWQAAGAVGGRDGALAADATVTSAEGEWCRLGPRRRDGNLSAT